MPFFKKLLKIINKIPNYIALGLIWLYRTFISPFYRVNHCIFYPTCSVYGQECFRKYPFFKALTMTINRIGRCHPGNEPRVDLP